MKRLYVFIVMVFTALAVITPVLATKVVNLFGIKFVAGIFTMLLAFSLVNVVNELWGKRDAQFLAVSIVLVRLVLFLGLVPLILKLPAYLEPAGYSGVLRMSIRTFLASEVATLVQNLFIDIPVFHALKKVKFGFFFRANVANILAWSFGTISFVLVSFWGSSQPLIPIMLGQMLLKFPLSFAYSWVGFLIVRKARAARDKAEPETDEVIKTAISADA